MVGEWKSITAEQFCTAVRDGTHDSPKPVKHGRFLVTSRHIIGGRLDLGNAYLISQDDFNSINKRSKVDKWDVLISMIGTVGEPCLIKEEPDFAIKNVGLFKSKGEVEGKWLYYYLRSPNNQQIIREQSRGTTQQYIPLGALRKLPIFIPEDKNEMRAIVYILGTLDDKIELNRRMSQTLEEMARAIFKSWFVDFDPVRAKAAVRREHPDWTNVQVSRAACPNLKPEIAELFPDRFVDSELGEIPEGWRVSKIRDCCEQIQNGGTPRRNVLRYWEGGNIPWLTSGEVRQSIITATESFITEAGLTESSAKWVPSFATVVALYGATAGQVSLTACRLTTNQAVCALIPKEGFAFYNYHTMRRAIFEMENKAVGSAQQNISKGIVEETQMVLPPTALVECFSKVASPIFERRIVGLYQSRTLASLRDALLPKLISGEIRVKDAEKFLEKRGL